MLSENINDLHKEIELLPEFTNESLKGSFVGLKQRMNQIHNLAEVKKYKVVFMGVPAAGKSTCISNWLGFVKKNKEGIFNKKSLFLLPTGAGRTTASAMHFKQVAEQSSIKIEYLPQKQQLEQIKEFCQNYYATVKGATEEDCSQDGEERQETIIEEDRIVRNMAGLERYDTQAVSPKALEKNAKLKALMNSFASLDEFCDYVVKTIDLGKRTCPEFLYDGQLDFEEWFSKTLYELNNGLNPRCSIPAQITVCLNSTDLDLGLPEFVDEVIDTLGIDTPFRPDLNEFLLSDDTLCIMLDKFENAPARDVKELLSNNFKQEWDRRYHSRKFSLLLNYRDGVLEETNGCEDDPEQAKNIKLMELERRVQSDKLPYTVANTLVLNPLEAYEFRKGKGLIDYDEETNQEFKNAINQKLIDMVDGLRDQLQSDADDIRVNVEHLIKLQQEYERSQVDRELIAMRNQLVNWKSQRVVTFHENNIKEILYWKTVGYMHHSTLKRINAEHGFWWKINLYKLIQEVGKAYTATFLDREAKELKALLSETTNEDAKVILEGYLDQLDYLVKDASEELSTKFYNWALNYALDEKGKGKAFWHDIDNIYGTGFKRRTLRKYEEQYGNYVDTITYICNEKNQDVFEQFLKLFPTA